MIFIRENSLKIIEDRLKNYNQVTKNRVFLNKNVKFSFYEIKRRDYVCLLMEAYTSNVEELKNSEKEKALKSKMSMEV